MKAFARPRSTAGFTMLELLISVATLSVGVLGVASLQILTTQSSFGATQHTEATMLANAVIDRMRANSERLTTYAGSVLDASSAPDGSAPTGCTTGMSEAGCLQATATLDLWELHQSAYAADTLIEPTICIYQDGTVGNVTVVIAWHGMSARATGTSDGLDDCGRDAGSDDTLQQVVMSTYITPRNPN